MKFLGSLDILCEEATMVLVSKIRTEFLKERKVSINFGSFGCLLGLLFILSVAGSTPTVFEFTDICTQNVPNIFENSKYVTNILVIFSWDLRHFVSLPLIFKFTCSVRCHIHFRPAVYHSVVMIKKVNQPETSNSSKRTINTTTQLRLPCSTLATV